MDAHRLSIGTFSTRCAALADATAAAAIGALLDRSMKETLPPMLADECEAVFDGLDGVVCIRHLLLRLDLGDRLEAGAIAARIAARVADLLRKMLERGDRDLRAWPDHASYLASYIAMRLGIVTEPAWPFATLAKLEHLPAERAAAELIRARPEILTPLARIGGKIGDPSAAVRHWPRDAKAALVRALLLKKRESGEWASLPSVLRQAGQCLADIPPQKNAEGLASAALDITLRLFVSTSDKLAPRAVLESSLALLIGRDLRPSDMPGGGTAGHALEPVSGDVMEPAFLAVFTAFRSDPALRPTLDECLGSRAPVQATPKSGNEITQREKRPDEPAEARDMSIASAFAGLGLLIPSIAAMGAQRILDPTDLAKVVFQCLAEEDWPSAAVEPALARLFPFDPRDLDLERAQPVPPAALVERLAPQSLPIFTGSSLERRWSALLIGDFASRLGGLRGSSHPYLQHEFLRRSGRIKVTPKEVLIRLDPIPLAIILRMAGLNGLLGPSPPLAGRTLVIDLGDAG